MDPTNWITLGVVECPEGTGGKTRFESQNSTIVSHLSCLIMSSSYRSLAGWTHRGTAVGRGDSSNDDNDHVSDESIYPWLRGEYRDLPMLGEYSMPGSSTRQSSIEESSGSSQNPPPPSPLFHSEMPVGGWRHPLTGEFLPAEFKDSCVKQGLDWLTWKNIRSVETPTHRSWMADKLSRKQKKALKEVDRSVIEAIPQLRASMDAEPSVSRSDGSARGRSCVQGRIGEKQGDYGMYYDSHSYGVNVPQTRENHQKNVQLAKSSYVGTRMTAENIEGLVFHKISEGYNLDPWLDWAIMSYNQIQLGRLLGVPLNQMTGSSNWGSYHRWCDISGNTIALARHVQKLIHEGKLPRPSNSAFPTDPIKPPVPGNNAGQLTNDQVQWIAQALNQLYANAGGTIPLPPFPQKGGKSDVWVRRDMVEKQGDWNAEYTGPYMQPHPSEPGVLTKRLDRMEFEIKQTRAAVRELLRRTPASNTGNITRQDIVDLHAHIHKLCVGVHAMNDAASHPNGNPTNQGGGSGSGIIVTPRTGIRQGKEDELPMTELRPEGQVPFDYQKSEDTDISHIYQREVDQEIMKTVDHVDATHTRERPWSFEDVLQRPVLVQEFIWAREMVTGELLADIDLPSEWISRVKSYHKLLIQSAGAFALHKFDLVVRCHVNTTHFHGGRLIMAFDFFGKHSLRTGQLRSPTYVEMTSMLNVELDVSLGNEIELVIPYENIHPYISFTPGYFVNANLGSVYIASLSRLEVPQTMNSIVSGKAFVMARNPELRVLIAPDTRGYQCYERQVGESKHLKNVSAGQFSNCGIDDAIHRLSLEMRRPSANQSFEWNGQVLELMRVFGLIDSSEWSYMDDIGFKNHVALVHPVWRFTNIATGIVRNNLCGVSALYHYWRGSIEYKLTVSASQFHTGRLAVVFLPGTNKVLAENANAAAVGDSWWMYPHVVFDIKEKHVFTFIVPYVSPRSWSLVSTDSLGGDLDELDTGILMIRVVEPLRSPNGETDRVRTSLYARAGNDYELAVPAALSKGNAFGSPGFRQGMDEVRMLPETIGQLTVPNVQKGHNFGEDFMFLHKLLSRHALLLQFSNEENSNGAVRRPGSLFRFPVTPYHWFVSQVRGPLAWMSQLFCMWSGSLRYKLVLRILGADDESVHAFVWHDPLCFLEDNLPQVMVNDQIVEWDSGAALQVALMDQETIVEIEIPFYSMYDRLLTKSSNFARSLKFPLSAFHNGVVCIGFLQQVRLSMSVYIAAGPDFRFSVPNGFVSLPQGEFVDFGRDSLTAPGPYSDAPAIQPRDALSLVSRPPRVSPTTANGGLTVDGVLVNGWKPPRAERQAFTDNISNSFVKACGVNIDKTSEIVDTVHAMLPQFLGTMADAHVITSELKASLPKIQKALDGACAMSSVAGFFTQIGKTLSGILKSTVTSRIIADMCMQDGPADIELFLWALVVGGGAFMLTRKNQSIWEIFGKVAMMAMPMMASSQVRSVMSYVTSNWVQLFKSPIQRCEGVRQGFLDETFTGFSMESVVHLLLLTASLIAYKSIPSFESIAKQVKQLGSIGRDLGGLKTGFATCKSIADEVSGLILDMLVDQDPNFSDLKAFLKFDLLETLAEIQELSLEHNRFKAFATPERRKHIRTLYDRIQVAVEYGCKMNYTGNLMSRINKAEKDIRNRLDELHIYKGLGSVRIDPVHICLYGESGIGKSTLMKKMGDNILDFMGEPLVDRKYARNVSTEYWDGYFGQALVTYDDLGAVVHTATPNDITEIINIQSNEPCMVHMADIKEKGKHFESKYIISSTNIPWLPGDTQLRHRTAFHRRRHKLIQVTKVGPMRGVDPQTGRLDITSHLRFQLMDPLREQIPLSDEMTYEEMMMDVCGYVDRHMEIQAQILKTSSEGDGDGKYFREQFENRKEARTTTTPIEEEAWLEENDLREGIRQGGAITKPLSEMNHQELIEHLSETSYVNGDYNYCVATPEIGKESEKRLSVDERFMVKEMVLKRFEREVEKGDVDTIIGSMDPMGRCITNNLLRHATLMDGKYLHVEDKDYREMYENLPGQVQGKIRAVWEMKERQSQAAAEYDRTKLSASNIFNMVKQRWDALSETQKTVIKISVLTSTILGIAGTLFASGWFQDTVSSKSIDSSFDERCRDPSVPKTSLDVKEVGAFESSDQRTRWGKKKTAQRVLMREVGAFESSDMRTRFARRFKGNRQRALMEGQESQRKQETCSPLVQRQFEIMKAVKEDAEVANVEDFSTLEERMARQLTVSENGPKQTRVRNGQEEICLDGAWCPTRVEGDPQYCSDPNVQNLIETKFFRNLALVRRDLGTGKSLKMNALFLTDTVFVTPLHFFEAGTKTAQEGDTLELCVKNEIFVCRFERSFLRRIGSQDLCVYRCGRQVPGVCDIRRFIGSEYDHLAFYSKPGSMLHINFVNNDAYYVVRALRRVENMERVKAPSTCYPIADVGPMSEVDHEVCGIRYFAHTEKGECGSPIIQHNPNTNGKILGIHVCAVRNSQEGVAELLVKERIDKAILTLYSEFDKPGGALPIGSAMASGLFIPELEEKSKIINPPSGQVIPVSVVKQCDEIRNPTKTTIIRTPLFGLTGWEHRTEPSILSFKDQRLGGKSFDPLMSGLSKYGIPSKPFLRKDILEIEDHMFAVYRDKQNARGEMGVLSLDQSINGIPGLEFYEPLNWTSSPGFPEVKSKDKTNDGKRWLFEENGKFSNGAPRYCIKADTLKRDVIERIVLARNGERKVSLSVDCVKDEKLPLKKIYEAPKTRTFSVLPLDLTIVTRSYFLDFCALVMANRYELGPKVGINPYSLEWADLYHKLLANSDVGFAGDYKSFDGQTDPDILASFVNLVNRLDTKKSEENAQVRHVLMNEIYHRLVLCGNTVFHVPRGLASGVPFTTICNSYVNEMYLRMAWKYLAQQHQPKYMSQRWFDKFVCLALFGDDNVVSIAREVISWFNLRTVSSFLREYNITLTDHRKRSAKDAEPWIPIRDTTFLKREFRPHPDWPLWVLAPLDKVSIEERVLWMRKGGDEEELLDENCRASFTDAYHHGREYFEDFVKRVNKARRQVGRPSLPGSYYDYDREWLADIGVLPMVDLFHEPLQPKSGAQKPHG